MTEQKMVGLFTVYNCNNSHPKGDVIFVHGLAGHPWATWHPQNQTDNQNIDFWPFWLGETLLEKKIDVNIWSFGYEAPGFKYFGQGMSRFDQASNLLESLKVKNIGDSPFIFVTHSLGGLIVKEVIRSAQNFPQYQDILQQIKGIVFLSTPHTGTHLNNLIQNIGFLTQPTVNIEELQEHSPQLRNLNEWYRQNVDKLGIQTKVFYETKPMNEILVVDEDSSNPGIRDVKPVAIPEDYISIAKPQKNDLVYLSTIKFCEEVFISKIEKNKFQEITPKKINAVFQGNNISGSNVGNTGVFQHNTIENINLGLESSGGAPTKKSTQLPENIPENFSRRRGAKKFVGRDHAIHTLHEHLQVTRGVAITGMGGIGKTELALQYAYSHLKQETYTGGICWIECRDQNVASQITSFAISQLNLSFSKDDDLQTQVDFCWRHWPNGDVLVIFDDVVNYKEISDFLPPMKSRFKILITTRKKWLTQSFQRLELEVLDKENALNLLISYVESDRIQDELEESEILCKSLGFLPWGLELVGRYLERKPNLSLAKARKRLGLEHSSLQEYSQDMKAERGLAAAFELSWKELDEDDKELGCLLSLFASARIPWYLVEGCFPEVHEEKLENRRDYKLVNLSLLQSLGKNCYEFHPLIREFFRNKLSGLDLAEEIKRNICRVIVDAAKKIPYENYYITVEQVKEVELHIPHIIEIVDNLSEYLSDDDLIVPFTRLGAFYQGQRLYSLAQPWLEKGKEIAEKRLDKDNSKIATVYNYLANLYCEQRKYDTAESLFLQAIEIDKIALHENHPQLAIDFNDLANLYFLQDKYEVAEPLFLKAIKIYEINPYTYKSSLAICLNNLATLYREQGKYDAAEPLFLQAIEIHKIALPENHPHIAIYLNNLATLYREQGKYDAAEPLFLQAIEIHKIALSENHPYIATDLCGLATLYREQGKYDAAEPLYLQAIQIDKIALPENHPYIATDLCGLATLYREQGKYDAAEPLFLQAIEIHKIALSENHPYIATDLCGLATLYREQGKYDAAEPLYLQAIQIDKIALPENHPYIATDLCGLATLYREQGKYDAAEPLFLQAIEIHKIALPENHPYIAIYLCGLATLYREQGKYDAAEPLYLQALEIFKITLPEKHQYITINLNNLAELYELYAESFYLKALKIYKQSLGVKHPRTQKIQENYQNMLNKKNN